MLGLCRVDQGGIDIDHTMGDDRRRASRPPFGSGNLCHRRTAASAPLEEALGHEPPVHRRHGVARDAQLAGQFPARGQPVARREAPAHDPVSKLHEQRTCRSSLLLRVEEEVHVNAPSCAQLGLENCHRLGPYPRPSARRTVTPMNSAYVTHLSIHIAEHGTAAVERDLVQLARYARRNGVAIEAAG